MARITKDPDVRRDELLEISTRLFHERGYTNVTVSDITTAAGIAKGTFYHYFQSKDDLLLQLVTQFGDGLFQHLEAHLADFHGTGAERLQKFLDVAGEYKWSHANATLGFVPALYRPENRELQRGLYDEWFNRLLEIGVPIIKLGVHDGTFQITDPEYTAEILLCIWVDYGRRFWANALKSTSRAEFEDAVVRGTDAIVNAMNCLLNPTTSAVSMTTTPKMASFLYDHLFSEKALQ